MGAECSTESDSSDCGPLTDYFSAYNLVVDNLNKKVKENEQYKPSNNAQHVLNDIKDNLQKKTYCIEPNAWRVHPNLPDIEIHFQEITVDKEGSSSEFGNTLLDVRTCITQLSCDWLRLRRRIQYIQMELNVCVQDLLKELEIEENGGK